MSEGSIQELWILQIGQVVMGVVQVWGHWLSGLEGMAFIPGF